MPEPAAKKSDVEKADEAVTAAKRKFYAVKRELKAFEQVHGKNPKGKIAADWAKLVDKCNEISRTWSTCKAAATTARQAEQQAALQAAEKPA